MNNGIDGSFKDVRFYLRSLSEKELEGVRMENSSCNILKISSKELDNILRFQTTSWNFQMDEQLVEMISTLSEELDKDLFDIEDLCIFINEFIMKKRRNDFLQRFSLINQLSLEELQLRFRYIFFIKIYKIYF